jgi:hypothetical protein
MSMPKLVFSAWQGAFRAYQLHRVFWCVLAISASGDCALRASRLSSALVSVLQSEGSFAVLVLAAEMLVNAFWAFQAFRDAFHTARQICSA